MKVLVTGSWGFIGSKVYSRLDRAGAKVVECDEVMGAPVERLVGKISDLDVVVHLAALTDAGHPDDAEMWRRNMGAFGAAFEIARRNGARFIFASSAAAKLPDSSAYAATKYVGERILKQHRAAVSLRYANVVGTGEGKGVLDHWARQVRFGGPIEVTGDGSQTRDFIGVDVVAEVTARVALTNRWDGRTIDVCSGVQTPILDCARDLATEASPIKFVERRAGDPDAIVQDPTVMRQVLALEAVPA